MSLVSITVLPPCSLCSAKVKSKWSGGEPEQICTEQVVSLTVPHLATMAEMQGSLEVAAHHMALWTYSHPSFRLLNLCLPAVNNALLKFHSPVYAVKHIALLTMQMQLQNIALIATDQLP